MHPKIHIFAGIVLITFLHFIFPSLTLFNLSIIFFSSWLIDVDHYFYYIAKEKDFNLTKCYEWHKLHLHETMNLPMNERKKRYTGFYIFHGVEPLIILFLLGIFVSQFFFFIFIGTFFHMFMDVPHEYYIKRTIQKSSLIYNYIQWKKLEKMN